MESGNTNGGVGLEGRVRQIVEEVLQGSPLFLVDLNVRGRKGSQVVDVFIESDTNLDVEELARVSRELGFLLDTQDVLKGSYNLNVSSPGVDRPLSSPRQFKKNVGRVLKVKHRIPEGGNTVVAGTLVSTTEDGIELEIQGKGALRIPYTDIAEAKVQLPW